jgi:Flp pilus assembly protein CpaB
VITLLASPEDAERLTLAQSEGKIQLVLRNPLDTHQESVDPANAKGLYKGGTPAAPSPRVSVHPVKQQQKTEKPPPSPSVFSVEVYKGDKKTVVPLPEQSGEDPK